MRPVIDWINFQYQNRKTRRDVVKAYHETFDGPGSVVLEDLRRYCFVYGTTHVKGDRQATDINEGKRQAYLHIVNMLETRLAEVNPPQQKGHTDDRDSERTEISDD